MISYVLPVFLCFYQSACDNRNEKSYKNLANNWNNQPLDTDCRFWDNEAEFRIRLHNIKQTHVPQVLFANWLSYSIAAVLIQVNLAGWLVQSTCIVHVHVHVHVH